MYSNTDLEKTHNLANKSTWVTAILTFFVPFGGYIYTGRYKQMFIGFAIAVGLMGCALAGDPSLEDDDEFTENFGFMYMIAVAIENSRAVHNSKKRTNKNSSKYDFSNNQVNYDLDNLKISLLKLLKSKGEMTTAECIVETSCDVQQIRQAFNQLQQDELITISNRSHDGAVVYNIV